MGKDFDINDLVGGDDGFDVDEIISEDKRKIKDGGGAPKNKGGRPRLKVKKEKRIIVYFTDEEYEKLTVVAEEKGISLSNLIRRKALESV
jgi:hypothetical protein